MNEFKPAAFLFDLNGTMINDMEFHLNVWHTLLNNDLGAAMSREAVKAEMYGKNHELLVRVFGPDRFSPSEADRISRMKEDRYQELYRPYMTLLPGLAAFLQEGARQGIKMAIGSAAIPYNIDFVVDELNLRSYFDAIVSADDVAESKPHPETYLKAAQLLGIDPEACLVFEDAPKGVEAAERAGMKAVVVTTMHTIGEFRHLGNVIFAVENYLDPRLSSLFS